LHTHTLHFSCAVKDSAEKDSFFKKLPAMIPAIPEPVAVRKLLPLLSSSLEFGGAPASAVSSLMLIGRYDQNTAVFCLSIETCEA
jgi:SCY1-like protein 1